jgi:glutamyl-tRNA synthetase
MVRTRFAPSPTGFVHIGSLRTALFSFLYARHNGGKHILRVEDTDQNRLVPGALENLVKVLNEMGIEFDEGFYVAEDGSIKERGEFGPYLQSKRLDIYHKYIEELLSKNKAYYCFCTEQRLEEVRREQMALKKPAMYDRHCRNLTAEESKAKLEEFKQTNLRPVVRFAIPLEGQTVIPDLVYGKIIYENKVLDDQVILKSDGFPTYHFAVVVDDHNMQITHVIRGDEWLPSTPKHILIYEAFGWEPTAFAHLPLILNPDKTKLSKRQGDVAVEDYLDKGYLKEALINFVAFMGWNPKNEKEIFSLKELIEEFDLSKVNKSGAVFDLKKLEWINSHYIKNLSNEVLVEKLLPFWKNTIGVEVIEKLYVDNKNLLTEIAGLEKERLKKLSEIGERTAYFFKQPEYEASLLIWKKSDAETTKKILSDLYQLFSEYDFSNSTKEKIETMVREFITQKNYDNGSVLWPLRSALTGLPASPGPFEVLAVLAKSLNRAGILERIQFAIDKL